MRIKPCPFCGKPAHLSGSENVGGGGPFYYVECCDGKCLATVGGRKTPHEAIENWNRRVYESDNATDEP